MKGMKTYIVTVNESDSGNLSIADVERVIGVNQHRSTTKSMARGTFAFADPTNRATLTKRASRRAR